MTDTFQTDPYGPPPPNPFLKRGELPEYQATRLLRPGEEVTWVRGPRQNPWWEAYATHPGLFVAALAVAGAGLAAAFLIAGMMGVGMTPVPILVAGGLVLGSIYVLAFCNGYFTRLVATNFRLVILQGYEVRRTWSIDKLPRSLVRYERTASGEESRSIDLDSLQTMLGGSSTGFTDAKTIRLFGKQLDQIRSREDRRD